MDNSKDDHGYMDKYFDTSSRILSQEMLNWNMKKIWYLLLKGCEYG